MSEEKNPEKQDTPHPVNNEMSEDEIDRNLEESFPSSDPPSWTLGTNHKEETVKKPEDGESE
jgi:hypothetical protein